MLFFSRRFCINNEKNINISQVSKFLSHIIFTKKSDYIQILDQIVSIDIKIFTKELFGMLEKS